MLAIELAKQNIIHTFTIELAKQNTIHTLTIELAKYTLSPQSCQNILLYILSPQSWQNRVLYTLSQQSWQKILLYTLSPQSWQNILLYTLIIEPTKQSTTHSHHRAIFLIYLKMRPCTSLVFQLCVGNSKGESRKTINERMLCLGRGLLNLTKLDF